MVLNKIRTLDAKSKQLKTDYVLVSEAVKILAEGSKGSFWISPEVEQFLPCYRKSEKSGKLVSKIFAHDHIELKYVSMVPKFTTYYEEVEVPISIRKKLIPALDVVSEQLKKLHQLLLDDLIVGYLQPIEGEAGNLGSASAHMFYSQKNTIYCTSYYRVTLANGLKTRALLSFSRSQLEKHALDKSKRSWGNKTSRALNGSENKKLDHAIRFIIETASITGAKDMPLFSLNKLANFLAQLAKIPLTNTADQSDNIQAIEPDRKRLVAISTIKNKIHGNQALANIMSGKGSPTKASQINQKAFESKIFTNYHIDK